MMMFNIRLIEQTTHQGSADFAVGAEDATAAARIVAAADGIAQAGGTNMVTLPGCQVQIVEAERVVVRGRSFLLLDRTGAEIREIPVMDASSRLQ